MFGTCGHSRTVRLVRLLAGQQSVRYVIVIDGHRRPVDPSLKAYDELR